MGPPNLTSLFWEHFFTCIPIYILESSAECNLSSPWENISGIIKRYAGDKQGVLSVTIFFYDILVTAFLLVIQKNNP